MTTAPTIEQAKTAAVRRLIEIDRQLDQLRNQLRAAGIESIIGLICDAEATIWSAAIKLDRTAVEVQQWLAAHPA